MTGEGGRLVSRRAFVLGALAIPAGVAAAALAPTAVAGIEHRSAKSGALSVVAGRGPLVGLSFDDGPDPRYTPAVLDLLAAHGVTATFFVVGSRVARCPDLCRRALAEGHELGNHTDTHRDLVRLGRRAVEDEINGGSAALRRLGIEPRYFRPPFGHVDGDVRAVVERSGLRLVLWDGCLERFIDHAPVAAGAARMVDGARPGDVLLAHDGGPPDRSGTLTALPLLLEGLARKGLRAVNVSTLLRERSTSPR